MDKSTLSNYGWIVIAVLVLSVMIALATPFGSYIEQGVRSTTQGLFDTSEKAMNVVGMSAGSGDFEDGYQGVGGSGNSETSTPIIITFTIDGMQYNAESGMNLWQWIKSEYNQIDEQYVIVENGDDDERIIFNKSMTPPVPPVRVFLQTTINGVSTQKVKNIVIEDGIELTTTQSPLPE